jgi:hypothetical protein
MEKRPFDIIASRLDVDTIRGWPISRQQEESNLSFLDKFLYQAGQLFSDALKSRKTCRTFFPNESCQ